MTFAPGKSRHLLTALHDTFMAGASLLIALYLRLGEDMEFNSKLTFVTLLCMFVCVLVFSRMHLYRGLWRYASTPDLIAIIKAATLAVLLFYLVLFLLTRLEGIPRSAPFIQWLLLLALLGAPRFFYRIWRDRRIGQRTNLRVDNRIPVLLIGAGDRAELFLRDMRFGPSAQYVAVGIVDDNTANLGRTIHDVRIYGRIQDIPRVVDDLTRNGVRPQRAILTYNTLQGAPLRELLEITDKLALPLARLPSLSDFKNDATDKLDIKPIAVEDLLGRAQNVHDKTPIQAFVAGKTVLVTGAGGTIGSELVRQIAGFAPKQLILFENSEYALYQIDLELARHFPSVPRMAVIGDVRNASQVEALFTRMRPQVVFHAAAIKHVPLSEINPEEAILTNVFGTLTIADACASAKVEVMVLISTDKAVNPTSLMGASKRAAEGYCQALAQDAASGATRYVAVRFGNVLGSTGSVVPLFQKQLSEGGPLTVTHKDMVRYFMTVREAVELVLQAATLGDKNGEVYVLDMGAPVKILDLAEQMIRLAGLKPYTDIKIEFTGMRQGEKLFEELFHLAESSVKTAHESIWLASPRFTALAELRPALDRLHAACVSRSGDKVVALLQQLVPEYELTRNDPSVSLPSKAS